MLTLVWSGGVPEAGATRKGGDGSCFVTALFAAEVRRDGVYFGFVSGFEVGANRRH